LSPHECRARLGHGYRCRPPPAKSYSTDKLKPPNRSGLLPFSNASKNCVAPE
jgi:hypothetical protein